MTINDKVIKVYCDGGSRGNPGPAACAFIVKNASNEIIFQQGLYLGVTTNNQAEYMGVIKAMEWLHEFSIFNFQFSTANFFLDSELVVKQLNGIYKIKNKSILQKILVIKKLISQIQNIHISYSHVRRQLNSDADELVNFTLDSGLKKD